VEEEIAAMSLRSVLKICISIHTVYKENCSTRQANKDKNNKIENKLCVQFDSIRKSIFC
jgi:hypothetical protein